MIPALALARRLWPYLAAVAALIGAYLWIDAQGYARGSAARQPEIDALTATVAETRRKTADAKAADAAHARQSHAVQAAANKESADAYETQLALLRARYDALRVQRAAASAHPGGGGAAPVSGAGAAAGGADGAAAGDRLLDAALAADENTLKLVRLQAAVRARDAAFNAAEASASDSDASRCAHTPELGASQEDASVSRRNGNAGSRC